MKIGILVNTDEHLEDIIGIIRAALTRGHEIGIFVMDRGTKLLESPLFCDLCGVSGTALSFCELSASKEGVPICGLNPGIISGSQYNNALMFHDSDHVIVL